MNRSIGSKIVAVAFVGLATLTACNGAGVSEPDASNPDVDLRGFKSTACGDAAVYLFDGGGTTLITITIPDLAARTAASGESLVETRTVGDEHLQVVLEIGRNLEQIPCNDAFEREPVILSTRVGAAGTFTFDTVAAGEGQLAFLTMTVDGLRFDDIVVGPSPHTVTDLQIGWYVG